MACVQMRRFEKIGMSRQQSEALTEHLTEVLVLNKEKISEAFVTRGALEKVRQQLPDFSLLCARGARGLHAFSMGMRPLLRSSQILSHLHVRKPA